jgi:hypothetical protein
MVVLLPFTLAVLFTNASSEDGKELSETRSIVDRAQEYLGLNGKASLTGKSASTRLLSLGSDDIYVPFLMTSDSSEVWEITYSTVYIGRGTDTAAGQGDTPSGELRVLLEPDGKRLVKIIYTRERRELSEEARRFRKRIKEYKGFHSSEYLQFPDSIPRIGYFEAIMSVPHYKSAYEIRAAYVEMKQNFPDSTSSTGNYWIIEFHGARLPFTTSRLGQDIPLPDYVKTVIDAESGKILYSGTMLPRF